MYRSIADRGPPESHVVDRFSSTYAVSYRPYEDSSHRHNIPIRCVPSTLSNQTASSTPVSFSSATASSRAARVWPTCGADNPPTTPVVAAATTTAAVATTAMSGNTGTTYQSTLSQAIGSANRLNGQPSRVGGASWLDQITDPIANKYRSKPPFVYSTLSGVGGGGGGGADKRDDPTPILKQIGPAGRNYKTACTAIVTDKPKPSVQFSTVETVGPSPDFKPTILGAQKSALPERTISVTPIAPHSPTNRFDFGQMFSQIARINDHLYLSSLSALTPERLRQHSVTLIVSATIDPPPMHIRSAVNSCLHVAVEDAEGANLRTHFERVVDRINAEKRRGGRILVHCMAGVSRSSTLVMAYLMRHLNMSLADAYEHVRRIRPCIQPNPGFWRQLLDYEQSIRGSQSVRLLPPIGYNTVSYTPSSRALSNLRTAPRSSYLDMFSRTSGDLLPYRPLTTMHTMDLGKPYIGCRQPLG